MGTSTTTNGRKTQSSTNDQGVVRKQITRHMADGTVEHEVSEEHKNSTTETQIVEYQQTITHLQSQLQLVDSKWTEAKDECHDLQRNSTALSDVMGTAVCEAVMKKAPGIELTVALLLIPRRPPKPKQDHHSPHRLPLPHSQRSRLRRERRDSAARGTGAVK